MALRKTPQDATSKWVEKLSAAGPEIEAGINRVTESPGALAAAQRQKWAQRVRETEQKWAERVGSVTLEDWRSAMKDLGVSRVAAGAQAKQGKYAKFAADFFPFLDQVRQRVRAMPSTTPQQRIARMVANAEAIRQYKRSS